MTTWAEVIFKVRLRNVSHCHQQFFSELWLTRTITLDKQKWRNMAKTPSNAIAVNHGFLVRNWRKGTSGGEGANQGVKGGSEKSMGGGKREARLLRWWWIGRKSKKKNSLPTSFCDRRSTKRRESEAKCTAGKQKVHTLLPYPTSCI